MTTESIKLREKVLLGLELSYRKLIKEKIAKKLTLVISRDGKVLHVDPRVFQKQV